jgi:hypothetical protein
MSRAISEFQIEILVALSQGESLTIFDMPGYNDPRVRFRDETISVSTFDALNRRKLLKRLKKTKVSVTYGLSHEGVKMLEKLRDKGRIKEEGGDEQTI